MRNQASSADYAAVFTSAAIIFVLVLLVFSSLTAAFIVPGVVLFGTASDIGGEDEEMTGAMLGLGLILVLLGGLGHYFNWW